MASSVTTKKRITDRLSSYWKMEAGCVVLIPIVMFYVSGGKLGPISYAAMVPMMLMLAIGAAYWRVKLLQITTAGYSPLKPFKIIRSLRPVALVLTVAALALTAWAWLYPSVSAGSNDRITASVASVLALAEYLNYYYRQLQHFDNAADFKRLLAGKGFRRSQMAVDLDLVANTTKSK